MAHTLIQDICLELGNALTKKKFRIALAESCTGGLVCQHLTNIPGSSFWFDRGFVTYSNESKMELLKVSQTSLTKFGAVSKEIASEMALGALNASHADIALSITGIAGPSGGSIEKPIGTVFFAVAYQNKVIFSTSKIFPGSRENIRESSCLFALNQVLALTLNPQV
ncbi:CinA family protein [Candidatus Methylopumilus rimovensis]|uniref:CinA family protein n=1 Tax=Candidatus Methylopumilus rimovensis TaxID=2588535 RepID=A0AAE6FSG5_9PROT|nr:CinA family protein [Candidatus Methylopumilus rimovensis]QDD13180.1 CinA family protein [Candidatus Methylopumilus rimovensis]